MPSAHPALAAAAALLALGTTACGSNAPSSGASVGAGPQATSQSYSVTMSGAITGTWTRAGDASESSCTGSENIVHITGPARGDEGDLHVRANGSVLLDVEKYGDFTADGGGSLRGNVLTVNGDLHLARGGTVHVTGSLSC